MPRIIDYVVLIDKPESRIKRTF